MTISSPAAPPPTSSQQATLALVLGILGIVCCGLCAPFAWYFGNAELKAIRAGQSSAGGETLAKIGMILGIIGSILLLFTLLWVFFWGGMAVLSSFRHH